MRLLLVNMPWHALDSPSLALGILHARTDACRDRHDISELYANLRWAEFILDRGEADPKSYIDIADNGFFHGIGDWVFSSALYRQEGHNVREYSAYLEHYGIDPGPAVRLHALSPTFIEDLAEEIASGSYDFVGFTSTFLQNVPSLALARRLKEIQPRLHIAFGGGNCDGIQGVALHRNFPFVDYVVRGEGEQTFVELLDTLAESGDFSGIGSLCWRDGHGSTVVNPDRPHAFPVNNIPAPNYDAYFDALDNSPIAEYIEPRVVVEAARGCWWGEKHQCTFCGLNGSMIKFRSKRPEAVFDEIAGLLRKHRVLDVVMVDNIMDMKYFKTLVPQLVAADWDLRVHYEVKSNLTYAQIGALREAHIVHVQPGIESLNSRVLRLMKKGVSGVQNVRVLRDCEEKNLSASWNYLYGFPGETADDYLDVIKQLPSLVHLQPPGGVSRIALERFSPNFDDPNLGFANRSPAGFYGLIYDLSSDQLEDMVYLFDTDDAGIGRDVEKLLHASIEEWPHLYPKSTLNYRKVGNVLYVNDRRANRLAVDIVIDNPRDVEAYLLLRRPLSQAALERELTEVSLSIDGLQSWLVDMKSQGLLFEEAGTYVALAIHDDPRRIRISA